VDLVTTEEVPESTLLLRILDAISASTTGRQAVRAALTAIRLSFGWSYACCYTFDESTGSFTQFAASGANLDLQEFPPTQEDACSLSMQQRDLIFIEDLRTLHTARAAAAQEAGYRSVLCFPLTMEERATAVMEFHIRQGDAPTSGRFGLLRSLARLVSSYIAHIRLSEEGSAQAQVSAALFQLIDNLVPATSLEGAIPIVLETLRSSFAWTHASFWALHEEGFALLAEAGTSSEESHLMARLQAEEVDPFRLAATQREIVLIGGADQEQHGEAALIIVPVLSGEQSMGVLCALSTSAPPPSGLLPLLQVGHLLDRHLAATEASRAWAVIESTPTHLVIADPDLHIQYINPASGRALKRLESYLPVHLEGLIGQPLEAIFQFPRQEGRLLSDPRNLPCRTSAMLGHESLEVTVSPIYDGEGTYLGPLLTWEVVTERLRLEQASQAAEAEIRRLIEATSAGKLSERTDIEQLSGNYRTLCDGINKMLDTLTFPIYEISAVLEKVGEGDLTQYLTGRYENDLLDLKRGVENTIKNLSKLATDIRLAAGVINHASGEIAEGIGDLAKRTEKQAASLQETASSMEEMTSTVKQTAESAKQARTLAQRSQEVAEQGGEVVYHAVSSMAEINGASKKMADIINVIDEIAFQTNLLALNAAVEAARAGEQGRGFAVVASEVRNLAGRSATAAKEIKVLIQDSVQKVLAGSRLVEESGKNLEEIVESVKKVSEIVAEISSASLEQSTGIEAVNTAVSQMDRFTQQNAALVEQTANAAETLKARAMEMWKLVDTFKVRQENAEVLQEAERSMSSGKAGVKGREQASPGGGARQKAGSVSVGATRVKAGEGFEEF
jgi:methyl-accepting chemotaxis protein/GAF domain-containing protein